MNKTDDQILNECHPQVLALQSAYHILYETAGHIIGHSSRGLERFELTGKVHEISEARKQLSIALSRSGGKTACITLLNKLDNDIRNKTLNFAVGHTGHSEAEILAVIPDHDVFRK